jgi:uncharacterized protein
VIVVRFEPGRLRVIGHANSAPKGQDVVCAAVSTLTQALYYGLSEVMRVPVTWETWDYGDVDIYWQEEHLGEAGRALVATIRGSLGEIAAQHGDSLEVRDAKA